MKKNMTLKEIAEKAGVTAATVSYVINDSARISEKTKEKVMKVIEETGYQTNLIAKGLRGGRTRLIGILAEDITVWHTSGIIDGINQAADELNYNIILSNLRFNSKIGNRLEDVSKYKGDIDRAVNTLLSMQVDGIIYIAMHDRNVSKLVRNIKIPLVCCYCYSEDEKVPSIRYDNEESFYQLTCKLIQYGHRKLGIIKGPEDSEASNLRLKGFRRAIKEHDIIIPSEWDEKGDWTYQAGMEATVRMFSRKDTDGNAEILPEDERPDAVLAFNDEMATGVYNAAAKLGLRIPAELSVTGFDDWGISANMLPPLTTIDRPLKKMGQKALEFVTDVINGNNEKQASVLVLPNRIIERESVRKS